MEYKGIVIKSETRYDFARKPYKAWGVFYAKGCTHAIGWFDSLQEAKSAVDLKQKCPKHWILDGQIPTQKIN